MSRLAAALVVGLAVLAGACGEDTATAAAPPPQAAPTPDPQGSPTTADNPSPQPAPQPSPGTPTPQPSPSPAPAPSPDPGANPPPSTGSPTPPATRSGTIRWAAASPGVFWVGMDDASARWSAADVKSRSVVRLEKRDRDGKLLWSGEWRYAGNYRFTAAVTPGGEPLLAALETCGFPGVPDCGSASIDLGGSRPGSAVAKIGNDGAVRWFRPLAGRLAGADASGASAVFVTPTGPTARASVTKLDADGNTIWTLDAPVVSAVRLDRTGDVLLTGCYQSEGFELVPGVRCHGLTAARLGPDGKARWGMPIPGTFLPAPDTAADGRGYVASGSGGPRSDLVALGPNGNIRWFREIGEGLFANQRGDPLFIAAAANGPVAVAGYTYVQAPGRTLSPPAILGFDAEGNQTWTLVPRDLSSPVAMVYGADGALLVATLGGSVDTPGGHVDGATVVELAP